MTNIVSKEFEVVTKELEDLAASYAVPSDTKGYEGVWLPPDDTVRMWSVPQTTAKYLQDFVTEHTPGTILELGTSSGYSALHLAAAARAYGGKVFTIEMAQPKIDMAQSYIDRVGFADDIQIISGEIKDVLQSWETEVDLVFLDADKLNYLEYIKMIEPHLSTGAIIIADNAIDFGHLMPDYIAYMKDAAGYDTKLIELDNGLLISYRK